MESTYDKIKKLVAQSEVSLLNEQIWQQHKTIMFLEERVTAFEKMMEGYTKVTMELAKEMRISSVVRASMTDKGRYCKSPEAVARRWAEWKALEEKGMTTVQIAVRWKVDRGTVDYAKRKGYVVRPYKPRKSSVPASLIGHELVSLPATRKGPRKQQSQLRLAA